MIQPTLPENSVVINDIALPKVDLRYKLIHSNDQPFMLYPDEILVDFNNLYYITNYCRIYHKIKKDFVKTIAGLYLPKWVKDNFPEDLATNPFTYYNTYRTSGYLNYWNNREKKLAYQRAYSKQHYKKVSKKSSESESGSSTKSSKSSN